MVFMNAHGGFCSVLLIRATTLATAMGASGRVTGGEVNQSRAQVTVFAYSMHIVSCFLLCAYVFYVVAWTIWLLDEVVEREKRKIGRGSPMDRVCVGCCLWITFGRVLWILDSSLLCVLLLLLLKWRRKSVKSKGFFDCSAPRDR